MRGRPVDAWVGVKKSWIPFMNETVVVYFDAVSTEIMGFTAKNCSRKQF